MPVERIPYFVDAAIPFLKGVKHIITIETGEPIAFFSYPGKPSKMKPDDCSVHPFVEEDEDSFGGLEMLAEAVGALKTTAKLQERTQQVVPTGKLDPKSIALTIAAALPENAILVDESLTTGRESSVSRRALHRTIRSRTWAVRLASVYRLRWAVRWRAPIVVSSAWSVTAQRCTRSRVCGHRRAKA